MEDTSGFYKLDGGLLFAPNAVYNMDYTLLRELHDSYTYPTDGWYWFNTETDVREFFGLPPTDTVSL